MLSYNEFPEMYRFLAILVALNFSSEADGDPVITLVEGGKSVPAGNIIDRQDLVFNVASKDTPALEATSAFPGTERDKAAPKPEPTLKPRMLGDSGDKGDRNDETSNRQRTKTRAATSKPGAKTRAKQRGRGQPSGGPTNPEVRCDRAGAAYPRGISPSSGRRSSSPQTSSAGQALGSTVNIALEDEKESAKNLVKAAHRLLSQDDSDPYNDKELAKKIESAVIAYSKAYDRPLLKCSLVSYNINELKEIIEEIEQAETLRSSSIPQAVFDDLWAGRAPKDDARDAVNAARAALDIRGANPFTDAATAQLIDVAIEKYNKAYERRPLRSAVGRDHRYQMNQKLDAIREIFDDLDKRDEDLRNQLAGMVAYQRRKNH